MKALVVVEGLSIVNSYHVSAINSLNIGAEFVGSSFLLEKKDSNQGREFWFLMGLRTQKADAGVGAAPA